MNKNVLKATVILGLIFLMGLFLRLYRLNLNTPPLYADETGQFYNYYVAKNHIWGLLNTVKFSALSFTWIFGLVPLGVRLPSAIYGSMICLAFFLFCFITSKKNISIALVGALSVVLLPWSFMISRIGHASIPLIVIFTCLHLYFFLTEKNVISYIVSICFLLLATYIYPSLLFILPFALLLAWWEIFRLIPSKSQNIYIVISVLLSAFIGIYFSVHYNIFGIGGRGLDLAIWRDVNTPFQIDKYRALSWNSPPSLFSFNLPPEQLANKLVYNRAMANITTFTHNYLSFFSPDWLFLKGDAILRHSTGQVGTFFPFLLPFMLYGAFIFFKTADKKTRRIFMIWILASPIPAAITKDGAGYLLRVVTMLPFLTYFCALGIVESFNLIKKNWRIPYGVLVAIIGLYSAYYFFYGYFYVYTSLSARSYEYGFKELSDFQVANNNAPMLVIWDGYYHNNDFRFWQNTPFDQYEAFKLKQTRIGESEFNQTFPNLYFVNPQSTEDIEEFLKQNTVSFVVLPDRYFVKYPIELGQDLGTPSAVIKYPDQTPALTIYSVK